VIAHLLSVLEVGVVVVGVVSSDNESIRLGGVETNDEIGRADCLVPSMRTP
jgi:hypothetical protein